MTSIRVVLTVSQINYFCGLFVWARSKNAKIIFCPKKKNNKNKKQKLGENQKKNC